MANFDHNILHIRNIYRALSSSEKRLFIKYLRLSEGKNVGLVKEVEPKVLKKRKGDLSVNFVQAIAKYQHSFDDGLINEHISKLFTPTQRRNLGNRVLKKIFDFLSLEANLERVRTSPVLKAQQYLTRNVALSEVLLNKGLYEEFVYFNKKNLALADKFELYNEACLILKLQLTFSVNRVKYKKFIQLKKEYDKRRFLADKTFEANMHVNSIQILFNEKIESSKIINYLETVLSEMHELNGKITSDGWTIYYNYIQLEYFQQLRDYVRSEAICYNIIGIYKRSPISTKAMLGLSYLQLAGNQLLMMQYLPCMQTCHKAITYFKPGLLNYIGTMEILFLAQFHSGKLEESQQTVEAILKFNSIRQNPIYLAKWEYYKTVILYKQGKFKEAYIHIQHCNDLYEDKEGWGIGLRILFILILLRRNLMEIIDNELDNFRRQLAKLKKVGLVNNRVSLIFKILSNLPKFDYDLKKLTVFHKMDLNLLDSDKEKFEWYVKGYELIRIEKELITK